MAGADDIAPDLINHLSLKGSSVVLNILNSSWLSSWCPQCWRSTYVSTFLKKGEGPSRHGKLPPNSADFDDRDGLGKIHRLSWWLEEHSDLGPWQASFRKGHNTTDQCLRLSQFMFHGFQSAQRQRTIATLFDFSRAYMNPDQNV